MKFYPVEVDGVPQLARTQAEVRALGYKTLPEQIEIDVSQQPLMELLNDLMRQAHAVAVEPIGHIHNVPVIKATVEDVDPAKFIAAMGDNGRCLRCGATEAGQQALIDGMDQEAIIARLEAGPAWMRRNVLEVLGGPKRTNPLEAEPASGEGDEAP